MVEVFRVLEPDRSRRLQLGHQIGGRSVPSAGGEYFPTSNPATGEVLCELARGGRDDVEAAVAAAAAAAGPWAATDPAERGAALRRVAELIRRHTRELGLLDTLDAGRPIRDTQGRDTPRVAALFDFFAGLPDKIRGATIPVPRSFLNYTRREPYGVVGAIVPWNFPLSQAATKVAPILACGNTLVLKPAEQASLTALAIAELCREAGIPDGVVNVVTGFGQETGAALAAHPQVRKVAFTGSSAVGRDLLQHARTHLKSFTLELGGKSPNLVFADADLDQALEAAIFSVSMNQGQTCTAMTRLLLEETIAGPFVERLVTRARALRVGDPRDPETRIGALISPEQLARVEGFVAAGRADGARLVAGGARPTGEVFARGCFYTPTIFTDVTAGMRIAGEEIFGPVVSVMTFRDEAEAVTLANTSEYGLAASIWTRDARRAHRMAAAVEAGLVWVNTVHALSPASPVGGYKESGVGLEFGLEAAEQYMRLKSVWFNLDEYRSPWQA